MRKMWIAAAAMLLLLLHGTCLAAVDNIVDQCKFIVSEGSASAITDADMRSAWKPEGKDAEVRIMLPEGGAGSIQINWTYAPTNFTLTEYDAAQNLIATRSLGDEGIFPCISQLYYLQPNAQYVFINFSQPGQGINKIRVFPEGELPNTVVEWQEPHEKCDLLVVSTHQDDEWLWFGGIIPYYDLVQHKKVQVAYMANCGRYRYAEALNGIAVSGVRTYPFFLGLTDRRDDSLTAAINTWNGREAIMEVMVAMIRRFKPEVILTHDWDGEYGHPQHIITSRAMEYVIEAAADPAQYPESAQTYGAWQVKKLYRHLETKDQIQFDWHVAYPEFGGRTGLQVATDSMNEHASQLEYYQVQDHGKYDNTLFGLSYSFVGNDVEHKDLFENIPDSEPEPTQAPATEPAAEAAPEVTPEPAEEAAVEAAQEIMAEIPVEVAALEDAGAEGGEDAAAQPEITPEPTPEPTVEPQPVKERGGSAAPIIITVAAVIACAGAGTALYLRAQARRRTKRRRKRIR